MVAGPSSRRSCPRGLRTAVRRRRLRPIVAFEPDAAVVWAPRLADGALAFAEVARVPLSGDPADVAREGHAAIDALPRVAYGGVVAEARVAVSLPASQVLRKTITLPAAVEENLLQALAYDLDRHTPFKPDEVYFDAIVVGRDPAKKEIRVDWAAALKTVVDQARRRAESWGAAVVAVTPESPSSAAALAGTTLNLLPAGERPDESMWRRWQIWVPLALIAILAVVATALPLWQKRGYAIELAKLADQARVQADASSALREELDRLAGDYNFALRTEVRVPRRTPGRRGRDEAPARRHVADAVRAEDHRPRKGTASRARPARRERECRQPDLAARGVEGFRAGGATLADDEDPARARRDLRSGRATEIAAAAAADPAGRHGRPLRLRAHRRRRGRRPPRPSTHRRRRPPERRTSRSRRRRQRVPAPNGPRNGGANAPAPQRSGDATLRRATLRAPNAVPAPRRRRGTPPEPDAADAEAAAPPAPPAGAPAEAPGVQANPAAKGTQ